MVDAENEFIRISSKIVFIIANFFGFWNEKILDLANNIILAIKMIKNRNF